MRLAKCYSLVLSEQYIYLINKLILFTQHYNSLVCHNYWHWGLFHIEKVWYYKEK